jgi:hypothetical protein
MAWSPTPCSLGCPSSNAIYYHDTGHPEQIVVQNIWWDVVSQWANPIGKPVYRIWKVKKPKKVRGKVRTANSRSMKQAEQTAKDP